MDDRTNMPPNPAQQFERMVPRQPPPLPGERANGGARFGPGEQLERPTDAPPPREQPQRPEEPRPGPEVNFDATGVEAPIPEIEEDPLSQVLSRPIMAHGEEITVLKWGEPTAGDIERAGNPIKIDFFGGKPSLEFDERKMSAMISRLAKIPPSSVSQITAGDWNAIAWKFVRFFMPTRLAL